MKLLVTGASGFLGRHCCALLARHGHQVVAATRRPEAMGAMPEGVQSLRVDALAPAALVAHLAGIDGVVHLAARVHIMEADDAAGAEAFRRVNVTGTATVLEAAREAGVPLFIYLSTIKVNGDGRAEPYTENDAPEPVGAYALSKLAAEELVREVRGMRTVIMRPPLVYGPGVGGNFRRLLRLASIARYLPLPLGGLHAQRSLIYVENLADAIAIAVTHPECQGTYLVADRPDLDFTSLLERLARGLGGQARLFALPQLLPRIAALVGWKAELLRMTGVLRVDASRFRALGWSPEIGVEQALERTVAWWRNAR